MKFIQEAFDMNWVVPLGRMKWVREGFGGVCELEGDSFGLNNPACE